jgi:hypothetical protein
MMGKLLVGKTVRGLYTRKATTTRSPFDSLLEKRKGIRGITLRTSSGGNTNSFRIEFALVKREIVPMRKKREMC